MLVLQEGQPRISTNEMFFACPMRGTARNVSIQNEFHGVLFIGYSLEKRVHRDCHAAYIPMMKIPFLRACAASEMIKNNNSDAVLFNLPQNRHRISSIR